MAQIVLNAGATVSFAGMFSLVYYEADTRQVYFLNGGWHVPQEQIGAFDIPRCSTPDGRQVLVPGFFAGVEAAHRRFGRLPFESLFGPSIYFAEQGFEINQMLGYWLADQQQVITRLEGGREIFLGENGQPYRTGDWFRQPALAETLTRISIEGASYVYRGEWAQRFVSAVQAENGRLSMADLESYEAMFLEPTTIALGDHEIHAPCRPGYGGALIQRALEAAQDEMTVPEMRSAGHYSVSPDTLSALLAGIERADQDEWGDKAGSHSGAVVAVDRRGNVASLTHSINTVYWGGTGIFVDGISASDAGCYSRYFINQAGPGNRLPTVDNETIATRDGVPVLASGAIGGGMFNATVFSLVDVLVFGMSPQEAVVEPEFLGHGYDRGLVIHKVFEGDFSPDLLEEVRDRGFHISEVPRNGLSGNPGWWIAIALDPETGMRSAATVDDWNGVAVHQPNVVRRSPGRRVIPRHPPKSR
jgi:gamma-glutamyltranspeptidase/glutathione hydrolase